MTPHLGLRESVRRRFFNCCEDWDAIMIVGIDVSKEWFDVAWESGGRSQHQRFDYTEQGISQLLEQTPSAAHYVMEATGVYHARLALKLHESGRRVSVMNPLVIRRFAQMQLSRVKSDKADAELIRRYGEQQPLLPWLPATDEVLELQQAHGWLDDLTQERTRLLNRQQAHSHHAKPSAFVIAQMAAQLQQLDQQIKACERHLEVLVKKSFAELFERLLTIPSIGPRTAIELIIVTDGFRRFVDVKALCAYIGVSPTTFRSGNSVNGKGGIAKLGQGRMRQLLYLCSWTAKTCNPACKALHARLQALGKPPKVINIAIAHKLLRQAFAVAMTNTPFSPEYA
jgi:transposase